jgi:GntR family transcriptional repressor for pyruvate dehydrogenase complex
MPTPPVPPPPPSAPAAPAAPAAPPRPIVPIPRPTLTDEIVTRLVGYILENGLRPDDKLPSERTLMAQLGVGRNSLREAVKTLSAVGVIRVAVGEGMFVGHGDAAALARPLSWALLMSESSAREVIQARRLLEAELAALAAGQASDAEVAAVGAALEAMREHLGDAERYLRHHLAFHLTVARAAHNRVLYHVLATLGQVVRLWIAENYSSRPAEQAGRVAEHRPVYEAIAARDPERARAAMNAHMDAAGARLLTTIARARRPPPTPADLSFG